MSSYFRVQPRIPQQERGARRVAKLLEAAEAIIAEVGYEATTMCAIAERAGASIGSLYQFFPSKACITQALRTEYAQQFDSMYAPLVSRAGTLNPEDLAGHLVDMTAHFLETHRALPALLDAPQSTRAPLAMRNVLRERFAELLVAQSPGLSRGDALRAGTATLHIVKAFNQLYAELPRRERGPMVQEFKMVLLSYFNSRLQPRSAGKVRR
jgi:AcrR family transcriptional regulator